MGCDHLLIPLNGTCIRFGMPTEIHMAKHTRTELLFGDLVICICGAVGKVHARGWWIFAHYEITWLDEREGKLLFLQRARLSGLLP